MGEEERGNEQRGFGEDWQFRGFDWRIFGEIR